MERQAHDVAGRVKSFLNTVSVLVSYVHEQHTLVMLAQGQQAQDNVVDQVSTNSFVATRATRAALPVNGKFDLLRVDDFGASDGSRSTTSGKIVCSVMNSGLANESKATGGARQACLV
jgi:hypothetical protein